MLNTRYLDRLAAIGVRPEDVDYVLCTHLHVDHVGWNTRLENGRWVPTFPNARYVFNGGNSVRRPQIASLTDRNCEGFRRPGNRGGLPGLHGGARWIRTRDISFRTAYHAVRDARTAESRLRDLTSESRREWPGNRASAIGSSLSRRLTYYPAREWPWKNISPIVWSIHFDR